MRDLVCRRSLLRNGGLAVALIVILQVGYACLQLSRLEFPSEEVNRIDVLWNPFYISSQADLVAIEEQIQEARQRAPYEAFLGSQTINSAAVMNSVRQKVNLRPFSTELWRDLIWAESLAQEKQKNRLASIEVARRLGGWNDKYYLNLVLYCLEEPPALLKHAPEFCRSLLANMPHLSLAANARDMGVHHSYLKSRIDELAPVYDLRLNQRNDSR